MLKNLDYNMPYSLIVSDRAKKRLKRLKRIDKALLIRILDKIEEIRKDPISFDILSGDLHDARKAKVGSYRIIFDIYSEEKVVAILLWGHRKDIYTDNELFQTFHQSKTRSHNWGEL